MTSLREHHIAALVLLLAACGPAPSGPTDSGAEGTATAGTTTGPVPDPPATGPGPGTTVPPPGDTTSQPGDVGNDTATGGLPDLPEDCSLFDQDCPPGFKCIPFANDGGGSWNATRCDPVVDNPDQVDETCTLLVPGASGIDTCDVGSMCWDVDAETMEGTCIPFCMGSPEEPSCAEPCEECAITSDGVLTLCFGVCDPLLQNCPMGQACYPVVDSFTCVPDASEPGAGIGAPCEFINGCPPSTACLPANVVPGCAGSLGCCAPYCPLGGADTCPGLLPGSTCTALFEEPPIEPGCFAAEPGVCVAP